MKPELKPLDQQVIVITGASSGIGLATAQSAAVRGAKLVLAARSEQALFEIVEEIRALGGEAISVVCDVADSEQVNAVARAALLNFGRIDTWINNAGVGIYGRLDEVDDADNRRLFETNFWGVVNGSLAALPHLRAHGGALINVGSEVSEAVVPLLGIYSASKHAVKGFTDALRVEIEEVDKAPVAITLIQPSAVDTPFPQHARNYQEQEAKLPPPLIEPEQVAEAILSAATSPTRVKKVGAAAHINTTMTKLAPALAEKLAAKQADRQHNEELERDPAGALHRPSEETLVVGVTRGVGPRD
jgi:short-subunit dehydrogenase